MSTIRLENISKTYGAGTAAALAVDDVTLTVHSGELFFLLGPSGCGKTTLLRMIAGLIVPSAGRLFFDERDVTELPVEKRETALVFQSYALWPHMTVAQNVEFGPRMQGRPRDERRRIAEDALGRVQMLDFAKRKSRQLSGGQQQRVALARALAAQPACLLLDEPLSNLDAKLRMQMRDELRRLIKATGTTALYVTHDQKEALSMADRVAVMHAGRVAQTGTPNELYERPLNAFVAGFVGEANFLSVRIVGQTEHGAYVLHTPSGQITAASGSRLDSSRPLQCCVRPEKIRIAVAQASAVDDADSAPCLQATVTGHAYLGDTHQYVCRLKTGPEWKVTALSDGSHGIDAGTPVTLTVQPEHVILLPEAPGQVPGRSPSGWGGGRTPRPFAL